MFVSAAIHGDEVLGVEIVRRLARHPALRRIRGTLLLIPIVNVLGFIGHSRYLPDRRDLNRSFPGVANGSLASQLANLFMTEIVQRSVFGLDLHSAAIHRTNLPQLRVNPEDEKALELAAVFGPPIIMHARTRPSSLRQAAADTGVSVLLYEAGEALRFDEASIRVGVRGTLRVLKHLGMVSDKQITPATETPVVSTKSSWLRAPEGGILRVHRSTGEVVERGETVGMISDPFGEKTTDVVAKFAGVIVGLTNLPVVNQGDGLFHIARLPRMAGDSEGVEAFDDGWDSDLFSDDDDGS